MKIKNYIFSILFFCGLTGLINLQAQNKTDSLTLQDGKLILNLETAIDIALSENPSIKVADMEITKKEYANKSAKGALLPQLDLIGQYQRTIKRQTVYFDGGFGIGGDIDPTKYTPEELKIAQVIGKLFAPDPSTTSSSEGVQMGRFNMWTTGLNVSLPLIVPSLWKNIQMTEVDIELALEKSRASKINMINQVTKSFYSLLLAQDSYRVFKETYTTDSLNLVNITNRFKQGVVAEYDVITADVRMKSLIPTILQSENMMKIAEIQLKMLMGIDSEVPLIIEGALTDYEDDIFNTLIPADTSLMNNSDLKQFDLGTQQAKNVIELQKSQFYPVLTSSFNYTYMSQNNDYKFKDYRWDPYSVVGISLAIPLFNGGQRYHNLKQSKIQVLQLQEQRKDLERGLKLQIKNNMDLINKNIEQIIATQSSIQQAQKGYEITVKRYETGLGTIVDVNAAALAVTNAQLQYRNAIYDYLAAKTDLEKVLGYSVNPYETESNK
ncbi:MAG: TolC family protein [Dysgonamonadaceae bacterium]|nr:TolC family protein [Dysgonamonadaceae bacterium]MDD3310176.1 TolC family protein [Dysgonamonadaceae bacterium]MDD3901302.1 TolC family protein [Dysgonamonadaceae bacterium]MDD4399779.1 TolC family protein [Dysgonamonadaceae bacterium]